MKKRELLLLLVICLPLVMLALLGLSGCAVEYQGGWNETAEYPYFTEIHTIKTSALAVELEEGEEFGARLWVWKEDRFGFMEARGWRVPSTLLFYVDDPYGERIVDAGRIGSVYGVAFDADVSGDYQLIFDDSDGYCVVRIVYNSPEPLRDINAQDN